MNDLSRKLNEARKHFTTGADSFEEIAEALRNEAADLRAQWRYDRETLLTKLRLLEKDRDNLAAILRDVIDLCEKTPPSAKGRALLDARDVLKAATGGAR